MKRWIAIAMMSMWSVGAVAAGIELVIGVATESGTPAAETAGALASFCPSVVLGAGNESSPSRLPDLCAALLASGDAAEAAQAYMALSPNTNTAISTVSIQAPPNVTDALLGARLAALRSGLKNMLARNDTFEFDGVRLPKSWMFAASDASVATDVAPQSKAPASARLSIYLNGEAANYEQDALPTLAGFDGQTRNAILGADYRIGDAYVVGAVTQFASSSADIADNGGSLDSRDTNVTFYGMWYSAAGAYLEASAGFGAGQFKLARRIQLVVGPVTIDTTAKGKPDGTHYDMAFGGGYDMLLPHGINGSLSGTLRYSSANIDVYDESDGAGLNLHIGSQTVASTMFSFSAQLQKAIALSGSVLLPQVGLNYSRSLQNDGTKLNAWFVEDPAHTPISFNAKTDDPDFALFSLGLSAIFPGGSTVFAQYEQMFLTEHFSRQSIALGWRQEL